MAASSYYSVLGGRYHLLKTNRPLMRVSKGASESELKKAYRVSGTLASSRLVSSIEIVTRDAS